MQDTWIIDGVAGQRFPAWTRGNAADVFPEPVSPLMWTFYLRPGLARGLRDAFIDYGVLDWDELEHPDDPDTFNCFGGYFYNPLSYTRLMGARMPGATPEAIDKAYFDERPDVPPYVEEPWHQSERHATKLTESMMRVMTVEALPELDAEKALADRLRAERPPLEDLPDPALLARARSMVPYLQQMFETGMKASFGVVDRSRSAGRHLRGVGRSDDDDPAAGRHRGRLGRTIARDVGPVPGGPRFEGAQRGLRCRRRRAARAPAGGRRAGDHRLRPRIRRLLAVLRFARAERVGRHRQSVGDPPRERPRRDRSHAAVGEARSPRARHAASVTERRASKPRCGPSSWATTPTLATFDAALRSADVFLRGRERYKTACINVVGEIRMCFRELGRRMVERGVLDRLEQIFMLLGSELDAFRHEPGRFTDVLREREVFYRELADVEPVFVINGYVPPLSTWPKRHEKQVDPARTGDVMTGSAGSGGSASGRARVVLDPFDPLALEPGDVLVAPNTDPSWTPLFVPAAAVVVDVGAMGSHAMIVCRELGIPCVVSVVDATRRIPDGALVTSTATPGP